MKLNEIEMSSMQLDFAGQDSYTVSFDFNNIPYVTATSHEDVNVYVESVSRSGCVVRCSAPITGAVYLNIIGKI